MVVSWKEYCSVMAEVWLSDGWYIAVRWLDYYCVMVGVRLCDG
jgi:hypothetical protein